MTEAQAKKLAKQIFDRFDKRIYEATLHTNIPPAFVAGLLGNEAGKDRSGQIDEAATRFEPAVYAKLKAVHDGSRKEYGDITRKDIADASDAALRALATSYGCSQIMGYHVIHALHCTIADLRNPDKHFFYTVKLLQLNGFPANATESRMNREMRQWNTGKETGTTYHENYVPNAELVRAAYRELENGRSHRSLDERVDTLAAGSSAGDPSEVRARETSDGTADTDATQNPPPSTQTQIADAIVNTGDKTVPDNFVPETKTVDAPPKEGSTKDSVKMTVAGFVLPAFLVAIIRTVQDLISQGFVKAEDVGNAVMTFVLANTKYVLLLVGLVIVLMLAKKAFKQITLWLQMWIAADPAKHDVEVKPQ